MSRTVRRLDPAPSEAHRRAIMLRLFKELKTIYALSYAAYEEACQADYARGYRARYCEHGTSQWTDYDNICGGCEDGMTMSDPFQRQQRATAEARERFDRAQRLLDVHFELYALNMLRRMDAKPLMRELDRVLNPLAEYMRGRDGE